MVAASLDIAAAGCTGLSLRLAAHVVPSPKRDLQFVDAALSCEHHCTRKPVFGGPCVSRGVIGFARGERICQAARQPVIGVACALGPPSNYKSVEIAPGIPHGSAKIDGCRPGAEHT